MPWQTCERRLLTDWTGFVMSTNKPQNPAFVNVPASDSLPSPAWWGTSIPGAVRCQALNRESQQCSRCAVAGSEPPLCDLHEERTVTPVDAVAVRHTEPYEDAGQALLEIASQQFELANRLRVAWEAADAPGSKASAQVRKDAQRLYDGALRHAADTLAQVTKLGLDHREARMATDQLQAVNRALRRTLNDQRIEISSDDVLLAIEFFWSFLSQEGGDLAA